MTGLRKGGWTLIGPTWPVAPPIHISIYQLLILSFAAQFRKMDCVAISSAAELKK
jgi:hypothetical protein